MLRARAADGTDLGRLHGWKLASWVDRPASRFSLRTIDDVSYEVIVVSGSYSTTAAGSSNSSSSGSGIGVVTHHRGQVIDHVEEVRAFWEIHEGAIVMNQGATYRVIMLDVTAKQALVVPCAVPYYTEPRDHTDVNAKARERSTPSGLVHYGPAQVSTLIWGYRKIWRRSGLPFENVGLVLPPIAFDTVAIWGDVPLDAKAWMDGVGLDFLGGCHGAGHAVMAVLPLHVRCDRSDLGTECPSPHQHRARPLRFIVYETHPGGVGIASSAFPLLSSILRDALRLVEACPCDDGCPACIQDSSCSEFNTVLDKEATIAVLRVVQGLSLLKEDASCGPQAMEEEARQ